MTKKEARITVHVDITLRHRALLRAVAALRGMSQARLVETWARQDAELLGINVSEITGGPTATEGGRHVG